MAGYNEMLRRIEPEKIICYNTPFPEMQGNIIYVDYERSSWRYMNYERNFSTDDLESYKIGGTNSTSHDIIDSFWVGKGGGSAYGGKWRPNPNKPNDKIYFGDPNSNQRYYISTRKGGYWIHVKYDKNGRAVLIRHETGHSPGSGHSDPHDHAVEWVGPDQHPVPGSPINYPDGAVPELKYYWRCTKSMEIPYDAEALRFHTISEFQTSMRYGAEVVIEWNGEEYGIWSEDQRIRITCKANPEKNRTYDNSDDALEYMIGEERLRDIITQVTVIDRTI